MVTCRLKYTKSGGLYMEFQLDALNRRIPRFFPTIANAIREAYANAHAQMPAEMHQDRLCMKRLYGFILPNVDYQLRRAIENAAFPDVKVIAANNSNGSAGHLEIHTPYGIFVVVKVRKLKGVPPKAKYRQKYVDQMFIQEVFPELDGYTPECKPLYVITHISALPGFELKGISLGRLTVEQNAWSCYYNIDDLCKQEALVETVEKTAPPEVREEIIAKNHRIQIKQA